VTPQVSFTFLHPRLVLDERELTGYYQAMHMQLFRCGWLGSEMLR
jgi:hypothetical protein